MIPRLAPVLFGQPSLEKLERDAVAAARRSGAALWYVRRDLSNVWQYSAGTTPVTSVGQPVGFLFDQNYPEVLLGPEFLPDPGFDDPSRWAFTQPGSGSVSVSGGSLFLNSVDGSFAEARPFPTISAVVGKTYRIEIEITAVSGGGLRVDMGGVVGNSTTSVGTRVIYVSPISTAGLTLVRGGGASSATVNRISVRAVSGAPAWQSTAANRPTVARITAGAYGLLFDGADLLFTSAPAILPGGELGFSGSIGAVGNLAPMGANADVNSADSLGFKFRSTGQVWGRAGLYDATTGATYAAQEIATWSVRSVGSLSRLYKNGVLAGESAASNGFTGTGAGRLEIGRSDTEPVPNGSLIAVAWACAAELPDPDRRAIERFGARLAGAPYSG